MSNQSVGIQENDQIRSSHPGSCLLSFMLTMLLCVIALLLSSVYIFFPSDEDVIQTAADYRREFSGAQTFTVHSGEIMPGIGSNKIVFENTSEATAFELNIQETGYSEIIGIPHSHIVDPATRTESAQDNSVEAGYGNVTLSEAFGKITIHVLDCSGLENGHGFMTYTVNR